VLVRGVIGGEVMTTIKIDWVIKDKLDDLRKKRESYADLIFRLIEEAGYDVSDMYEDED